GPRGGVIAIISVLAIGLGAVAIFVDPIVAGAIVVVPAGVAAAAVAFCAITIAIIMGLRRVGPPVARAIARAARFVWRPFDRTLRAAVRALGRAIVSIARPLGHAIEFCVVVIGRSFRGAIRAIRRVVVPIGHAIAIAARAIAHGVASVASGLAR